MELNHEFTVPASLEETWAAFDDIASVGECFPGAQVTSVEDDTFSGTVKVKLGPIALVYNGTGTFVEKDQATGTMKIQAKGKDKRGNGTAGADVVAQLHEEGASSTRVTVHTDLAITGKPAQFGRGVIQDVSDKLLGQFVDCLAGKVGQPAAEEPAAAPAAPAPAAGGVDELAPRREAGTHRAPSGSGGSGGSGGDDALDLGAAVVPILLKTYGKQAAAGLGVLVLLWWVLGRRG